MDQNQVQLMMEQVAEHLMNKISQKFSEQAAQQLTYKEDIKSRFDKLDLRFDTLAAKHHSIGPTTLDSVEELMHVTIVPNSVEEYLEEHLEEHLPDSLTLAALEAQRLGDTHEYNSDIVENAEVRMDETISSIPGESLLISGQQTATLDRGLNVYQYENKHTVQKVLTFIRRYAPRSAAHPAPYDIGHQVWKPGLRSS